ncbi:MCD, Malonyl-CoA decarboxylase MCD [Enemella dayhoffiae]|uniref:MCD, Malonyl-CoA decarboxylase MCD n=1 Tax=Enemella dayhoffiae TaxID=2016507 RepID=A0A255GTA2_9ACTN|nr:malonyl-CoA decarboxylase family protein [Enemella dayhoffiae]OYO18702.1 MCD, Malonyl-CoA decarboxylase MCD [Enemella dayhoffiae]
MAAYAELDDRDRRSFFVMLRDDFGVSAEAIEQAYAAWARDRSATAEAALFEVVEPRRQELLRRLNSATGGTARLVRMRADLLTAIGADPSLAAVDVDFAHLFRSWFNRGFLAMRRIDWTSSAALLELIMNYETVHPMTGWADLRRRMEPADHRLYAFFHPATGKEPLIFVEVALTDHVPGTIAEVLTAPVPDRPVPADTAVFYSINNTLAGLRRVNFGNFLIKQVVADLSAELLELHTFVTLSPAPGFAAWLAGSAEPRDRELVDRLGADWVNDPGLVDDLRPAVEAAAARYFVTARDHRGRPVDPVARFHLGNGAAVWRTNWPADRAPGALRRAYGLMVNYRYEPDHIEANHEAYVRDGVIAHHPDIAAQLTREREER